MLWRPPPVRVEGELAIRSTNWQPGLPLPKLREFLHPSTFATSIASERESMIDEVVNEKLHVNFVSDPFWLRR